MAEITAAAVKELREVTGVGMMECKKALVESGGDLEVAKQYLREKGQAKALKKSARETKEGAVGFIITGDHKQGALVKVACETDFVAKNERFQAFLKTMAQQVLQHGDKQVLEQPFFDGEGSVQELFHKMVGELGENIQYLDARRLDVSEGLVEGYVHTNGKVGVLIQLETSASNTAPELKALAKDLTLHITAMHAEALSADDVPAEVLEREKEVFIAQAKESGKPDEIIEKMVTGRINKFLKEVCVLSQPFVKNPEKTIEDLLKDASQQLGTPVALTAFSKFSF